MYAKLVIVVIILKGIRIRLLFIVKLVMHWFSKIEIIVNILKLSTLLRKK